MREVIKEARSVEEALDLGCQELGVERGQIDFEIIALPKRGFLGLRNTPAKVRVYVEETESPAPGRREPRPEKKENNGKEARPEPRREQRKPEPRAEVKRPEGKPEPRPEVKKPESKPEQVPAAPKAPQPEAEKPREPLPPQPPLEFVPAETVDGKARTAADYVKSVLAEMGVAAEISVAFTENGIVMRLSGEGLGVIIGRRGETLDALQYLSGLVANRQEGDYMRVTIDSGNYREKRERTLQQLARKLSAAAVRNGRPSTLEPMNPYERRIIHSTVSEIEGVSSASVGEEPNRRVVITPENQRPQQRRGRGGSRPPRRDGRPAEGRPHEGRPYGDRPRDDRPREERPYGDRPRDDRPREDRPYGDRPRDDRPRGDRPYGDRPPRRDGRDGGFHGDRGPRRDGPRESVKPTSTDVDREYAKEIEREAEHYVKADPAEQKPETRTESARPQAQLREGEDLPLYGRIDL